MFQPKRWLIGLAPLSVLGLATGWFGSDIIEKDLVEKSSSTTSQAENSWVELEVNGRNAILRGTAPDIAPRDAIIETISQEYGVRQVIDETKLLELETPYIWSASKGNSGVEISGSVPNQLKSSDIESNFRNVHSGQSVSNSMNLARGAPDNYDKLTRSSAEILSHLTEGRVTLSGMDLSVEGSVKDRTAYDSLRGILEKDLDKDSNHTLNVFIEKVDNFEWTATIDQSSEKPEIVLSGYVPDGEQANAIKAKLAERFGETVEITNKLIPASHENSETFDKQTSFASNYLSDLQAGKISLLNGNLSIDGAAINADSAEKLIGLENQENLPDGLKSVAVNLRPTTVSPYVWSAKRTADKIILNGFVPSEEIRETIINKSRRSHGVEIEDNMALGSGDPDGWIEAVSTILRNLGRLDNGEVSLTDQEITLKGNALYSKAAEKLNTSLASQLPDGFAGAIDIGTAEPGAIVSIEECQEILNSFLSRGRIYFETGKADISPDSFGILDRLIYSSLRCPEAKIEIGGHTDSDGDDSFNLDLSEKRASSVKSYLSEAGVSTDRLAAKGYGETRPVSDNDTEEGKAKNRRIEFQIIQ